MASAKADRQADAGGADDEGLAHGQQQHLIARSEALADLNSPAISVMAAILARGYATGDLRRHAGAIDVRMMISAFCFFRVSSRYAFGAVFGLDLLDASRRDHYRQMAGDMVASYLTTPGSDPPPRWDGLPARAGGGDSIASR